MKSGIYCLKSKINGKMYIGLSKDVYYRKRKHFEMLAGQRHHNTKMQRHFNKYGSDDLVFEIIELCDKDVLEEREMYWIDYHNSFYKGFNETKGGSLKDYCATRFDFENIHTGEILENVTASEMCEKYNIDRSGIYKLAKGKGYHQKGWKLKGAVKKKRIGDKTLKAKQISLKNIHTGEIITAISQQEMAKKIGVHQGCLSNLFLGKNKKLKDWCLPETEDADKTASQTYFTIQNVITGEIVSDYHRSKVAKEHSLDFSTLCKLINGGTEKHKDWILVN